MEIIGTQPKSACRKPRRELRKGVSFVGRDAVLASIPHYQPVGVVSRLLGWCLLKISSMLMYVAWFDTVVEYSRNG